MSAAHRSVFRLPGWLLPRAALMNDKPAAKGNGKPAKAVVFKLCLATCGARPALSGEGGHTGLVSILSILDSLLREALSNETF